MKTYELKIKLTEFAAERFMIELINSVEECKRSKDCNGERLIKSIISTFELQIKKQRRPQCFTPH